MQTFLFLPSQNITADVSIKRQPVTASNVSLPKSKSTSLNWYGPGGQANWFFGLFATSLEHIPGSVRFTNGAYNGSSLSFKYYASAWRVGSKARITTYNIGKIGGLFGKISFGFGFLMDAKGVVNYYNNPKYENAVSPGKAVLNTGIGAYGVWVNPAAGMLYFGVDAFYPGGWPAAMEDNARVQHEVDGIMNTDNKATHFYILPWGAQKI